MIVGDGHTAREFCDGQSLASPVSGLSNTVGIQRLKPGKQLLLCSFPNLVAVSLGAQKKRKTRGDSECEGAV